MDNERKIIEVLTDTKARLDDIKDLNGEIHNALDLIEEHRKTHNSDHSLNYKEQKERSLRVFSKDHDKASAKKDEEAYKHDQNNAIKHAVEKKAKQEEQETKNKSASTGEIKPKSILKVHRLGTFGFKERLNLAEKHVLYGSQLRRTVVEMHQDNRLCSQFELEANVGGKYPSKRSYPLDSGDKTMSKMQNHAYNQNNKQEKVHKPETSFRVNDRQRTSFNTSSKSNGHDQCTKEKKEMLKASHQQTKTKSDVAVLMKTDDPKEYQVEDKQTGKLSDPFQNRLIQVSQQEWINIITDLCEKVGFDEEQKQQYLLFLRALMDSFFEKGQNINLIDFLNMSKDTFMEKMMTMLQSDKNLSENDKRLLDHFTNNFFDENGKMNPFKGMQMLENDSLDQLQSVVSEALKRTIEENSENSSNDNKAQERGQPSTQPRFAVSNSFENNMNEIEDNVEERTDIDPALWVQYANEEIKKARVAKDIREGGMDTIICVDASQSMRGVAWQQATTFIKNFVEGIQNTTLMDSAYEHIALVTFGSETCVQKHLTCDYVEIIRKLDRLRPGGPSPMYAGLQMVHAAVIGAGMIFKSNGKRICPRVFLITDGKATPAGMIAGPDHCPAEQIFKEQLPILDVVKTIHEKFHANFYPVPVGDFNLSILENIVKISNGKIVSPEDWRMQSRVFKNYLAAAKLCGGISKFMAPGLSTMMLDALNASSDDKAQMEEFIHTHQQDDDDDDDSETYEEDNFPPLGSRVCLQLSGSTIMTESKQDLGTVTKHFQDGRTTFKVLASVCNQQNIY